MRVRLFGAITVLSLALSSAGCGSEPASTSAGVNPRMPKLVSGTDAGAMADLQASDEWKKPSCRWLETSAHSIFYPQDEAVLLAARSVGYARVEQVGTGNRIGTPQPAWSVELTESGKAESAKCGPGSARSTVFGVPVSGRHFISGKRTTEPDMYNSNRTIFDVEFEWMPTAAGEQVKNILTSHMTVQQGLAAARVVMLYGDGVFPKGPNGWVVQSINEPRTSGSR